MILSYIDFQDLSLDIMLGQLMERVRTDPAWAAQTIESLVEELKDDPRPCKCGSHDDSYDSWDFDKEDLEDAVTDLQSRVSRLDQRVTTMEKKHSGEAVPA